MAANMPWYKQNSMSGSLVLPTLGWASTFINPKLLRSPMNALPVCEKVSEYPQKNH
jgi:hypothetical protein